MTIVTLKVHFCLPVLLNRIVFSPEGLERVRRFEIFSTQLDRFEGCLIRIIFMFQCCLNSFIFIGVLLVVNGEEREVHFVRDRVIATPEIENLIEGILVGNFSCCALL